MKTNYIVRNNDEVFTFKPDELEYAIEKYKQLMNQHGIEKSRTICTDSGSVFVVSDDENINIVIGPIKIADVFISREDIVVVTKNDDTLVIPKGAAELRYEAINKYGCYVQDSTREEDGLTLVYDDRDVIFYIEENLIDFAIENLNKAII